MLLMAAVNPLNDPDDFIDERQRLTLTYAATILVDDEDASFPPPAGLDIPTPDQGLSPPEWNPPIPHFLSPPASCHRRLCSGACFVLRSFCGSFIFGMFVSC